MYNMKFDNEFYAFVLILLWTILAFTSRREFYDFVLALIKIILNFIRKKNDENN